MSISLVRNNFTSGFLDLGPSVNVDGPHLILAKEEKIKRRGWGVRASGSPPSWCKPESWKSGDREGKAKSYRLLSLNWAWQVWLGGWSCLWAFIGGQIGALDPLSRFYLPGPPSLPVSCPPWLKVPGGCERDSGSNWESYHGTPREEFARKKLNRTT